MLAAILVIAALAALLAASMMIPEDAARAETRVIERINEIGRAHV